MKNVITATVATALRSGVLTSPTAYAATTGQYVRTESGKVRCWVSANDQGHGGGPVVACEASGPMSKGFLQAPLSGVADLHWILAGATSAGAR